MADDWLGIGSAHIDSLCGEEATRPLSAALDGGLYWAHYVDEVHWFILDLGLTYTIKKVRGKSVRLQDPIDVDIYVSEDKENWGAAVASGIATWLDTEEWQEVETVEKNGRYIKVVINITEDGDPGNLQWGKSAPGMTLFDAYGDVAAVAVGRSFGFIIG